MYYQPQLDFAPDEVLVYLRKSRSDDPSLTVEEVLQKHETILDEWSESHLNGKVPEANKFREVVSGETIADRPEIQILLKKVESPKIKAVLIVEVQRLSRGDLEDAGRLIKILRYTNTLVITPPKTYDLRDEYDRDAFERELKRGNEFLEYQKKIMNRGRLLSVSQGNYIGSQAPYGYEKTTVLDGKKKCPTLKIKEDEADVVRMIFDMYANQGVGRTVICHRLDNLGIKPAKGDRWSPDVIRNILMNLHYIGKVKWNWRKTITIIEDSEIVKIRPRAKIDDCLIYNGKHPAIVSEELFQAVQEKLGKNHRSKATTKLRNPLAGILFCQCGRAMIYRTYVRKNRANSEPRLLCSDQVHCGTASCLYDEIIDRVCDILKQCIEDFEIRLKNDAGDSAKLHTKLIKNLEKKLKDLEAKELSQWEAQSDPDPANRMPQEIFKQLNAKLLKEKEEVQQALCKAYESMPEPVDYAEKAMMFQDALNALKNPDVDAQLKNRLLKACIERIEYKREKPQRIKGVKGGWVQQPINIDVKLKV